MAQTGVRLIPAHAGKTRLELNAHVGTPAHPRSRGENAKDVAIPALQDGSSPLTRGKPRGADRPRSGRWLIPAHAGKTLSWEPPMLVLPAHPRSRGENQNGGPLMMTEYGSSPLTRGKPPTPCELSAGSRLIPAHAGKTASVSRSPPTGAAHPRSRGENGAGDVPLDERPGSSPLTRGKPRSRSRSHRRPRLIPAHAGKTASASSPAFHQPAHPRSRGENSLEERIDTSTAGSSPLTRGKPQDGAGLDDAKRLIPTHAGKTDPHLRDAACSAAHPHSRGENAEDRGREGVQVRLIPTHAGKTF